VPNLRSKDLPIGRIERIIEVITTVDLAGVRAEIVPGTEELIILESDDALKLRQADGVGDGDEGRVWHAGRLGTVVEVEVRPAAAGGHLSREAESRWAVETNTSAQS
jgi:hypothetical protein